MSEMKLDKLVIGDERGQHVRITGEGISLFDSQSKERLTLTLDRDGGPGIALNDGNGTERVKLYLVEDGFPFIEILDGASNIRVSCSLDPDDNAPYLAFYGRGKHPALEVGLDHNEAPALLVRDEKTGFRVPWLKAPEKK